MRLVELMTDLEGWADSDGRHPGSVAPDQRLNAEVGTLRVVERHPAMCANGHALVPPNYRGSWLPCTCAGPGHSNGHRVVGCARCGHEWFYPPHTDTIASAQHWAMTTRASSE